MKKTIAIILCLALCLTVIGACGKDDPPPPPPRERTVNLNQDSTPRADPPAPRSTAPSGFYTVVSWEEGGEDVMQAIAMMADLFGIQPEEFCFMEFPGGNVCIMYMYDEQPEEGTFRIEGNNFTLIMEGGGGEVDGTISGNRITLDIDGSTVVFERNERFTGASSPPPAPAGGDTIPAGGGSVRVTGATEFTFVPNQSGLWEFQTSDNGTNDPYLEVYDANRRMLADDDDSAGNYNARVSVDLTAGQSYIINARFWGGGAGSYMLTATFVGGAQTLSGGGGSVRVNGETEFTFVPNHSGFWEFHTSDNGSSDPILEIYDANRRLLADDDDSGEGYNALVGIDLNAGQTYIINARFWAFGGGSYMLTATFYGSHIGDGHDLPGSGGSVIVAGEREFPFVPNQSGMWEFRTSDNGNSDPMLEILDSNRRSLASDDDSGDGYNALITINLEAGRTYYVVAKFWFSGSGDYILHATPMGSNSIPAGGGTVQVNGETEFTFVPNQSGRWEFRTSNNGNSDPVLEIYDSNRRMLAEDDDGGDGLNSLITIDLNSGSTYYVVAKTWWGDSGGSYTLTVTRR